EARCTIHRAARTARIAGSLPLMTIPSAKTAVALAVLGLSGAAFGQGVAYYRFEEGSGTQYFNSLNGLPEATGNVSFTGDVPVQTIPLSGDPNTFAVTFNGGQFVECTPDFVFNAQYGDATVEFWLNAPDQSHHSVIWSRADDTDANRYNISINPGGF